MKNSKFLKWLDIQYKKLNWNETQLVKLSVFAFALAGVRVWYSSIGLPWYWYFTLAVIALIKPTYKIIKSS